MKTQMTREEAKKELDRIKESRYQNMLSILKSEGIDASQVPRTEFDKLLRIQREVSDCEIKTAALIGQFNEIIEPYRITVETIQAIKAPTIDSQPEATTANIEPQHTTTS